jgi:hypothetical protein
MAGHLIKRMSEDPHLEREAAAQEYCQWIQSWFFNDIEKLKQLYARWR